MRKITKIKVTDDLIDNLCHGLLQEVAGQALEWNAEAWGAVREAVEDALLDVYGMEVVSVPEKRTLIYLAGPEQDKIKCPRCGVSVPDVPEGATYEETLCCRCYDELEMESNREA